MKLKDKITIVTGASSGMGKEIARLYLAEGAVVYGIDLNKERLDVAAKEFSNDDFRNTASNNSFECSTYRPSSKSFSLCSINFLNASELSISSHE